MFDLKIDTASNAYWLIQQGKWPTCAISLIGDSLRFEMLKAGDHHLILKFDDTEVDADPSWVAPTRDHINAVFTHTANLTDADRLLVHCHAGKSRSTAMAIGILIQHGMAPEAAFERVKELRPMLLPNRLMIQFIDETLGLGGELEEVVRAYYKRLTIPGVNLPNRGGHNL